MAEFTLGLEQDLRTSGRFKPFICAGTSVMVPLKESYDYVQSTVGQSVNSSPASTTLTYTADAQATVVTPPGNPIIEPPSRTPHPYVGVVQAGVGASWELSENTSLIARAQFQKALKPIGMEDQSYVAVVAQAGLRFDL
jgi:hypothetical protein